MAQEFHGFRNREEWTKWLTDYNLVISGPNDSSYDLILSQLPSDEWVAQYKNNSAQIREAFRKNEEMLDWHIRWFTRTPGRWTREVADPLLAMLFRYVTRVQDLGTAYELSESLLEFYGPLGDEVALMKCYTIRAFSCDFLDTIHLSGKVHADCTRARKIYESCFFQLTPEEQSMGLSIYDLEFDRMKNALKLSRATPKLLDQMIDCYMAGSKATAHVLATDKGYEFNAVLPEFDHYIGFTALCLSPGMCTSQQKQAILRAAEQSYQKCCSDPSSSQSYQARSKLVYLMAKRLNGLCTDRTVLDEIRMLMKDFAPFLFAGSTYSQHTVEAVETIQLATETLTSGGKLEPELYADVQELFIQYFSTRPYTTLVDYVCGSYNYCYILTALPHITGRKQLLEVLLKLTMFRQVQTAMHSIMVGDLATEILNCMIGRRPELLVGQLDTSTAEEVCAKKDEFLRYLYCGALLHDIGKLLCSSVINAQSHRLGDLEFQVLKYHPVTGGEMLEHLPELSVFRDLAVGHQKSFDGTSGYPADFDNTASPQKIFIDIITICDSLDAATDHLGRNYATAKSFDTVMDELRAGRGTRYSGDIVDLLDTEDELRNKLRFLLEENRQDIYYNVHQIILSHATLPMKPEKTHHWLFDPKLSYPVD